VIAPEKGVPQPHVLLGIRLHRTLLSIGGALSPLHSSLFLPRNVSCAPSLSNFKVGNSVRVHRKARGYDYLLLGLCGSLFSRIQLAQGILFTDEVVNEVFRLVRY
jgi:hypothetical protein